MAATTISEARANLPQLVSQAQDAHERILLTCNGEPAAALVSVEDLKLLRALEDRLDLQEAEAALQEAEETGLRSWEDVKRAAAL